MTNILRQPKGFYKGVLAIMLPLVLQNLITQTVALADTFMVGLLGQQQLAAMTVATTPLFVFTIFTFGLQSGSGILVAQYWGKGDTNAINRVLGVALYVAIAVMAAGAALTAAFPAQILDLVTGEKPLVPIGAPYTRIAGFSMFFNAISMIYIACQRSMENAKLGVIVLASSSLFNVFGNWVLIFGELGFPELGIVGAAVATLCSRVLEVVIVGVYALRNTRLPLKIKLLLRPGLIIFRDFMKYSLPVLFNEALWGFGAMLYPVILGHMLNAEPILAAYNIAGNLERLFAVAVFACANACAVTIGRELGAGRQSTVESVAKSLLALSVLLGFGTCALLLIARAVLLEPFVYPIFSLTSDASAIATAILTIIAISMPIRTFGFTMGLGIMRGGGDVKALMFIDVGTLYLISLPLASIAALILKLDIAYVYSSILIEDIVKTLLLYLRVRKKKWIRDITREILE